MPVKVVRRGDVYRVVEAETLQIARAKKADGSPGKARDGGGKRSKRGAQQIANAINRGLTLS